MSARKRIVVKIGSSLLANSKRLTLRYAFMHGLLSDIADLREQGYDVVLTSSGAVALGLNAVNKSPEDADVLDKQAAAACGQPLLLNAYGQVAAEHGFIIGQVLVTLGDIEERRSFLNIRNTIQRLFEHGVMPVVNENDTVTTQEIRVGDNDRLAAKVAHMIQADHLIILTSVDGLYDRDPSQEGAQFIEAIDDVSDYLAVTDSTSALGSGGMLTKMHAANMAQDAGCTTLIARGIIERPISSILANERRHTRCIAKGTPTSSWQIWLANRLQMAGSLVLKQERIEAMRDGDLGVEREDIVSTHGDFQKGDVLHIYNEAGDECARGLTNFSSNETLLLARHLDQPISELLGYEGGTRVISRENVVMLKNHHLQWDVPTDQVTLVAS